MYVALVTYSKCIGCSGYLQQVYLLRMLGNPRAMGVIKIFSAYTY